MNLKIIGYKNTSLKIKHVHQMKTSIVVPLYNEEKRAGKFLGELLEFSKKNLDDYEIILVNDGSNDNTLGLIKKYESPEKVKIISYEINRGKGGALKEGFKAANGEKILFIDADGSIPPQEITQMLEKLDEYDVVIGDRTSKESDVDTTIIRKFTQISFNFIVNLLYNLRISDTLCGFKGFKKNIGKKLFGELISDRWIFDVEILYRAKKNNYKIFMLPIKWEHRSGSKITALGIIKMAFQLLELRLKI